MAEIIDKTNSSNIMITNNLLATFVWCTFRRHTFEGISPLISRGLSFIKTGHFAIKANRINTSIKIQRFFIPTLPVITEKGYLIILYLSTAIITCKALFAVERDELM